MLVLGTKWGARVMAERDLDAVIYVKSIPDITFEEDGLFHVLYSIGRRSTFEFVFTPNTFLKMRQTAGRVVDQFHEHGKVLPIRKKRGTH
jgi:hypothetical protein